MKPPMIAARAAATAERSCAPRAHVEAGAIVCGDGHTRGGGGDGGVIVENREENRLQEDRFGERADHCHDRGAWEVNLAFTVTVDVTRELVIGEPIQGFFGEDVSVAQVVDLFRAEAKILDGLQSTAHTCDDAVAPVARQATAEDLEDGATICCARLHCRVDHRQFIHVCEQSSA